MKSNLVTTFVAAALLTLPVSAQDRREQGHTQFDDKDRQTTTDWYNQHKDHRPAGLRDQDRLPANQESQMREGAVLDKNMRKKVHPIPQDLGRQLPPPPSDHRYVAVGGHVGLIDNNFQVKAVIHLH